MMPTFTPEQLAAKAAGEARANALTIAAPTARTQQPEAGPAGAEPSPTRSAPAAIAAGGAATREGAGWVDASVAPAGSPPAVPIAVGGAASPATAAVTGSQPPAALTLFDAIPAARHTDPATSHQAAASITPDARRAAHHAVLAILAHGPATDFDLAATTGLKQTSIGKRRGELRDAGLVTEHDRAGISDTGSACIRWALTDAGRAEHQRQQGAAA